MDRKYDVITLGEILLRLSTPINGRLAQGDTLMKHLGGAELNIASEIGQLGLKTAIISKIPNSLLAAFIKNQLNASRVSENYLIEDHSDDSRVGIYYYEYGSYPRKPRVVYDRKHSSINHIEISDVPESFITHACSTPVASHLVLAEMHRNLRSNVLKNSKNMAL